MMMAFVPAGKEPRAAEGAVHPFYISVTEINQNAAEKSLEISCKFFADDFEQVLEKSNKVQLDIMSDKEQALIDKYIPLYINKHFSITGDGRLLTLRYVGFEREKESVYCYFEVTNLPSVKQLSVSNNLLYDLTPEQINIMHVTVGGKRQSSKLNHPEVKALFQF
jgi:hypothetical protein